VNESVRKLWRSVSSGVVAYRMVVQPDLSLVDGDPPVCYPDAFSVTRGGYVERTHATGREFPIQGSISNLRRVMRTFVGPAHLPLGHPVADDLVHCELGDAAAC
jgi:hypothetical protein